MPTETNPNQPIAPALRALKRGQVAEFEVRALLSVRSTASQLGAALGRKYTVTRDGEVVRVIRLS